jgi:alpha-mannosidase
MLQVGNYQTEGADVVSVQKQALDALVIPPGEHITIHMTHLNHLDLTWYWRLPDTVQMCLETIRWHTELLEKHPDARYTHTQVFTLKVVEQVDYPLFQRFLELVKQGRMHIDSGQIVEPDHNMPSGESLARQFLYGQRFLRSRFGLQARTLVNSDSFGHTRSLPQIMRLAGIDHMIFKRPRQRFLDLPETPFQWRGLDGTRIYALRFINKGAGLPSLSQYYELPEGRDPLQEKIDRNLTAGIHNLFGSHCASDAGGVTPYAAPCSGPGYTLTYSDPTSFFEAVLAEGRDLPVVDKLLNYVYDGCYTTHIAEKENCRRAERELRQVEFLWTLASLLGHGYPADHVAALWWRLCFLQFHDILPGTGSPDAHTDTAALYHELFLNANVLRRKAQLLLDSCVEEDRSVVVANPRLQASGGIAQADVMLRTDRESRGALIPETGTLIDSAGNRVPYQIIDVRTYQRYARGTMIFPVDAVPPMGIASLRRTDEEPPVSAVSASDGVLENEHLRVEVGGPGIIRSLRSKADDRECLRGVPDPVRIELWPETDYLGDYGSPMKAWFLGVTDVREPAEAVGEPEVIENGPVRATIRTEHRWGDSAFRTDVSLYAGQDWVELRFEIDWHEKEVLTRLCVEPELRGRICRTYGIPFGAEHATGEEREVPVVGWADMSGDSTGLAVLSLDRPGHTFRDNCIRTSLVRCATGDHDPCTDSGTIRATVRLLPHRGDWRAANAPLRSDEFSHPLIGWQCDSPTTPPNECPKLPSIVGDGILLSSIKLSEDGDGYILRLVESLGRQTEAALAIGSALEGPVLEGNILEDATRPLEARDGIVSLSFRPFEIKTLIIRVGSPIPGVEAGFSGTFFAR